MKSAFLHAGLPLLCTLSVLCGENPDLSGYTRDGAEREAGNLVPDGDFEKGAGNWTLKGSSIEKHAGRNGTSALRYERSNPRDYQLAGRSLKLEPGKVYRFGAWVKTERVTKGRGGGATISMDFFRSDGKGGRIWIPGCYSHGLTGTNDWTWCSNAVRVPENAESAVFSLHLRRGATGVAWYDDASVIRLDGGALWSLHPIAPGSVLPEKTLPVSLAYDGGALPAGKYVLQMQIPEAGFTRSLSAAERMTFPLPELPDGPCEIKFQLLDTVQKRILFTRAFPMSVRPARTAKVKLDEHGRLLVSGRLFMPIGIFASALIPKELDILRDAGINCILPYGSMELRADPNAPPSGKQILRAMDFAAERGIMVIFSLKSIHPSTRWFGAKGRKAVTESAVRLLKDHPALLAWYTADEKGVGEIPAMTEMRRICNRLVYCMKKFSQRMGNGFHIVAGDC